MAWGFLAQLEVMREQAGLPVARFCELAGVATSTWYRHRARHRHGAPAKGRWPRPVSDHVVAVVHALALQYPAWGHRKIWARTVAAGHEVSQRTVYRILAERGLIQPARYQAERRELAKARKATFAEPPTRRNRVGQTDFSEYETTSGGTWQLSGVVDYAAKLVLTCPVTATKTWREAVAAHSCIGTAATELGASGPARQRRQPGPQRPPDRVAREPRRARQLLDRLAADEMLAPQLSPLLHIDHPSSHRSPRGKATRVGTAPDSSVAHPRGSVFTRRRQRGS